MRKLFVVLLCLFVFDVYAETLGEMEPTSTVTHYVNVHPDWKINRDTIRTCLSSGYEHVCVDGVVVKEICKVTVNGLAIFAGTRGGAANYISSTAGLLTSDLLCERFNTQVCRDIWVCKSWGM